ncbi:Pleckstriny domain-containing family G member 7 [Biomphalaria pfeifferi]|uniref:Pleckstriny domain-containing family G member 7 n=1 Tax=Biomphalaria pfeifferi TaxID=112525 RepID=A0AAD8C1I0_BIOPF|nr:Pleckstriny domain-containing family G member 7 [Biomphalaria pfeifferi]
MYHKDEIMYHKDVVMYHKDVVMYHKDEIMYHKDVVMYHKDVVMYHKDVVMYHKDEIMYHKDVVMYHRDVVMHHRDVVMYHKDVVMYHKDVVMYHKDVVMYHKDEIMYHKDVVMYHRDVVMYHRDIVMHHRDVVMRHRDVVMHHKDVVMYHKDEIMYHKDVVMYHKDEIMYHKDVVMYHKDVVMYHKDVVMYHKDEIMYHKDVVMYHRDVVMHHRDVVMYHKDVVMYHKDVVMYHKDVVMYHKDKIMYHKDVVMYHKDVVMYHKDEIMYHKDVVMYHKDEIMYHKDVVMYHKDEIMYHRDVVMYHKDVVMYHKDVVMYHKDVMKTKSKESLTKLDEILRRLKPSEFKDKDLAAYKSLHWSDLIASTDKQHNSQMTSIIDTERKRREAVWELFKSECVFLIDHLMVLKHCFMEPLKKVQVEGSLMFAEPQDLFGNLDELSYVSYTFCKDFIAALLKDMSITDFGRTNVLLKAFQRFSAHSRDGAVYHSYCLNYANALTYLEKLRANSEFSEFEKWCEQDSRCNRLQLTDLLVAPMQHCTKLPLLLHNVRKYTADEDERQQVAESIEKMEASLKQLEEKMKWIKNFERVQEIQRQIVWPTVTELDPRCVIPESLKSSLCKQPCERLLICPKRQLLHEGQLTLVETPKPLDIHMFLFDDILLISKVKKIPRKSKQSNSELQTLGTSDRTSYIVLRQPLALDRFTIHDISPSDAAVNGLKHCFVLVHISRFQQIIGAFTFQAACDATKNTWLLQIRDAMEAYAKAASSRNNSFKENRDPKAEEKETIPKLRDRTEMNYQNSNAPRRYLIGQNSFKNVPTKSRSMDAVFI